MAVSRYEESLFLELRLELSARDLPQPERQYKTGSYRLDFAWPGLLLCVEVDGGNWIRGSHTRPGDYARRRALALAGWRVLPYHSSELRHQAQAEHVSIEIALAVQALEAGLVELELP